jgi:hypothetical protein
MRTVIGIAAAGALACAGSVCAHHAHQNYHQDRTINLSGRIVEVHWLNPHVWLFMEVTDTQGQKSLWPLEGTGIAGLERGGWRKDSIKTGDTISVRCHPLKDGDKTCLLGFVTSINGVAMDKEFN